MAKVREDTRRAATRRSKATDRRNMDSILRRGTVDTVILLLLLLLLHHREATDSHTVDMARLRRGKLPMAIRPREDPEAIRRSSRDMDTHLHTGPLINIGRRRTLTTDALCA